jgi:hypothetical protein
MAGPDIAPLHSITSLPPYTPAGSVASAYTPSGGDANACMNDTGVPLSAATTGGANRMMSANAVGKAPSQLWVISDFGARLCEVCSTPMNGHRHRDTLRPKCANSGPHPVRASMQGKPKRVGRRSNWNKIGKHGHAYEPTPEPSTRGVVDIT